MSDHYCLNCDPAGSLPAGLFGLCQVGVNQNFIQFLYQLP
ncbi:MAG: hypothetical protein JWR76_136 [Mucilaginibacter sp.]|nr:hypothetical protein [Mucilaginibacter sp.]